LGGPVIGRHPNAVNEEISHPKNDKGDGDCEKKAFGIHERG